MKPTINIVDRRTPPEIRDKEEELKRARVVSERMKDIEEFVSKHTGFLDEEYINKWGVDRGHVLRETLYELMRRNVIFIQPQYKWRENI